MRIWNILASLAILALPLAASAAGQVLLPAATPARSTMVALDDAQLSGVSGQALFVMDKIAPNSLPGQLGANSSTDFTFYRIGMDVELAMNVNVGKMQLGCGGVNDAISTAVCDLDADYVRLMGASADFSGPGAIGSDFVLRRPYLEFAVRNDGTGTSREVAGIKIGAQSVTGWLGAGRRYTANGANQEALGPNCNTGASSGNGVLGCHGGITSLSGFLGTELSATLPVSLEVWPVTINATGCAGNTTANTSDQCGVAQSLFIDVAGTRMRRIDLKGVPLYADGIASLIDPAYAWLTADLAVLHGFGMANTQDFFLSFQREPVSYPRYSKTAPPNNLVDICNSTYAHPQGGGVPSRCSSAYAVPANTGWWINVPQGKVINATGDPTTISGLSNVIAALGYPGYRLTNPDLNLTPAANCWNSRSFC